MSQSFGTIESPSAHRVSETLLETGNKAATPDAGPSAASIVATTPGSSTSVGQPSAANTVSAAAMDEVHRQQQTREPFQVVGMQKWVGRIVEIDDEVFTAELTSVSGTSPTLLADFQTRNLGPDDAPNARPGDIVYVTVRSVEAVGRGSTMTSNVRLRRLGRWTQSEVDQIEELTRRKMRSLADLVD